MTAAPHQATPLLWSTNTDRPRNYAKRNAAQLVGRTIFIRRLSTGRDEHLLVRVTGVERGNVRGVVVGWDTTHHRAVDAGDVVAVKYASAYLYGRAFGDDQPRAHWLDHNGDPQ